MPQLAIMGGLAAASAVGGALSNRKSARTSTSNSTQTQQQTQSRTSTARTSRTLLPEQTAALGQVSDYSTRLLTDPTAGTQPLLDQARNNVNANYAGLNEAIRAKMLSSGVSNTGKLGTAIQRGEIARLGAMSNVESDFARMILERQSQGASLAESLLGMNFGSEASTSDTATMNGTGTFEGTQVGPGSMVAGAFGNASELLAQMWGMDRMMRSGGGTRRLTGNT